MDLSKEVGFSTKLVHGGEFRPLIERAIVQPIFQSSTYETIPVSDYNDNRYIRLNNTPNHITLGEKLAAIEGGEAGLAAGSGMAAITTALLAVVEHGGHVLAQDQLYGGTHHFFNVDFKKFGRSVTFFSLEDLSKLDSLSQPNTRAIYTESVSNPLLQIPDHRKITEFAKRKRLLSLIDNTFPSPLNFNPIAWGYDLVLHSATKYLNGHSDIVAGAVIGSKSLVKEVLVLLNHLGGTLDPHACFLLNRGMKTLSVRMKQQNETSLQLAKALEASGKCKKVIYPGLPSHPQHGRAKEYFRGFGGIVTFEYNGTASKLDAALKSLNLAVYAPSLGGVETLVTCPVQTSHSGIGKSDLEKLGLSETLVRVSVGLEDADDLIKDFLRVL